MPRAGRWLMVVVTLALLYAVMGESHEDAQTARACAGGRLSPDSALCQGIAARIGGASQAPAVILAGIAAGGVVALFGGGPGQSR